jgi:hypothetical protein
VIHPGEVKTAMWADIRDKATVGRKVDFLQALFIWKTLYMKNNLLLEHNFTAHGYGKADRGSAGDYQASMEGEVISIMISPIFLYGETLYED